jgi:hypothetical protein
MRCADGLSEGCEYALMNELEAIPHVERRIERVGGELHECFGPLYARAKRVVWRHCSRAIDFVGRVWPGQALPNSQNAWQSRIQWFQMPP